MALWISEGGEQFDDGLALKPGEEGFTRDLAAAHFGKKGFNYSGTPNWELGIEESQRAEAAARQAEQDAAAEAASAAAAKDRIAQLLDPEGYARAQAEAAIMAEHEALAPFASKAEAAQLDAVREARLASL